MAVQNDITLQPTSLQCTISKCTSAMCNLFHWVLQALISWASPFAPVFSVFNEFCCFGQSLRLPPAWQAAQVPLSNLNAHLPHATASEGSCRFYGTPPWSQFIWGYSQLNLKRSCYPWLISASYTATQTDHKQEEDPKFGNLLQLLLTCLLITSLLRGKACLSCWQNILQPKTWATWN